MRGCWSRWTPVARAERYEIVTTLTSGGQRITRTRRTAVTITRARPRQRRPVTVRAIAPMRTDGQPPPAVRATGKRTWPRFGPLPKLKRR